MHVNCVVSFLIFFTRNLFLFVFQAYLKRTCTLACVSACKFFARLLAAHPRACVSTAYNLESFGAGPVTDGSLAASSLLPRAADADLPPRQRRGLPGLDCLLARDPSSVSVC